MIKGIHNLTQSNYKISLKGYIKKPFVFDQGNSVVGDGVYFF